MQRHHPEGATTTEPVASAPHHERWNYWTMALYMSCYRTGLALIQPDTVLPFVLMQLTPNPVLQGLASSLYLFFWTFPQSLSAFYTARIRETKPLVSALMVLHALPWAILACYFIWNYSAGVEPLRPTSAVLLIYAAVVVFSILGGSSIPGYMTMIGKTLVGPIRIQFMGYVWCISALLTLAASMLMRHLLAAIPFPLNFAILFLLAFSLFCMAIACWAETKEPPRPASRVVVHDRLGEYYRDVLDTLRRENRFRSFVTSITMAGFGLPLLLPYMVGYAVTELGQPPQSVAWFLALLMICQSLAGYVTGRYLSRHSASHALLVSLTFIALTAGLLLLVNVPAVIWPGYVLAGLAQGFFVAGYQPAMFEVTGRQDASVVIGITNTIRAPFFAMGPILGGILQYFHGFHAVAGCALAFSILSALFLWPVVRGSRSHVRLDQISA
jgi:MFS family permease